MSDYYSLKSPFEERNTPDTRIRRAIYSVGDINRNLVPDINVGDTVIQQRTDEDSWTHFKSRKFKVIGFYQHFALLRNEYGYNTGVGYLELKNNYHKKGAKSKYALETL